MNDVRKMIYGTLIGFFLMLVIWFSIIYVSSCGFTFTCHQAAPLVERTPLHTLIPSSHSESQAETTAAEFNKCQIAASDLVGAWVSAGSPEAEVFPFTDANGQACEGTYADDIQPLFVENSLWYTGSLGCTSCHNGDLSVRSAGLDMTSYAALMMGSQRAEATAKGNDVLGGGTWEKSVLYDVLVKRGLTVEGHSVDVSASNPLLFAGSAVPVVEATPTP